VAAIVTSHGGTVSAVSSPGQGMAVTVRLPVVEQMIEEPSATT
jgi:signal transduction histidine kinase